MVSKTRVDNERSLASRKQAGKQPTLRPRASTPPPPKRTNKRTSSPRRNSAASPSDTRQLKPWQNVSRRILTRSQSKIFPLLDLAPELRALVFSHAARPSVSDPTDDHTLDLTTFELPRNLSPSRQVRNETVPIFFAANHFRARVMSNYCVFMKHFHDSDHLRYYDSGLLQLAPVLQEIRYVGVWGRFGGVPGHDQTHRTTAAGIEVPEVWVRFRRVTFEVDCVCCTPGKLIAKIELSVQGSQPVVAYSLVMKAKAGDRTTPATMDRIFGDVETQVEAIGKRDGFNGFTVIDLVDVAARVRCGDDDRAASGVGR